MQICIIKEKELLLPDERPWKQLFSIYEWSVVTIAEHKTKRNYKPQMAYAAYAAILYAAVVLTSCGKPPSFTSQTRQPKPDATEQPAAVSQMPETELQDSSNTQAASGPQDSSNPQASSEQALDSSTDTMAEQTWIVPEGNTMKTRILTPPGYTRISAEPDSFAEFLREYPLKEDKSPVLLYDGTKKRNQNAHAAVFSLPIEPEDLQQCADSVIRIYAEYFRETGQEEKIAFHFVNGFLAEYTKWREGYRIVVNGNDVAWEKTASYDDSYENFTAYLRMVFAYASTLSMEGETKETSLEELQAGDVFLQGGSPGHVVMVLDVCENAEGEKAFLLGQGYMPAQEFHILKNPGKENDPWYYENEVSYPFQTPEYTFQEGSLKRPNDAIRPQ